MKETKSIKLLMAAGLMMSATGMCMANVTYDAGQALANNLGKGGTFTDASGCVWTFGALASDNMTNIAPLAYNYSHNGWFEGLTSANGSAGVPFAIVNTSDTAQAHGGETGNRTLDPGEIVVHPNNPNNAERPFVGIRSLPPHAGIYRIDATVRDLSSGSGADGVHVFLYANGMVQQEAVIGIELSAQTTTFSIALYLPEGEAVTLIVDPRSTYNNDSTGIFFSLTELATTSGAPIVNGHDMYAGLMNSSAPALPATVNGVTIDAGSVPSPTNKTVTALSTRYAISALGCDGFDSVSSNQTSARHRSFYSI